MSPELLDPERFGSKGGRPTKQSDCYALGMVVYEVLSGQTPFTPSTTPVVIRMILDGQRPVRPQGEDGALFVDDIWRTLEFCWKPRPSDRPSARNVLLCLEKARPSSDVAAHGGTNGSYELEPPNCLRITFINSRGSQVRRVCMATTNARFHRMTTLLV